MARFSDLLGFVCENFPTIYQLDLLHQPLSSLTVLLKTPWNREIEAAAKQCHSLPRVGFSAEGCIPPCQDCHPYYYTSNNKDYNIKLNHSITPEDLGGKENVCMLVFWLPRFGPKGWREDAWKTRIPPHHLRDIWVIHWQQLFHSNAAPIAISLVPLLGGHI